MLFLNFSLSRLAAYISSMEVFQVTLRKGYGIPDLKLDLANLYQKAGLKNLGTVFLMTDAQVADEKFLVLINNLLASGEIPDLFVDDEVENIGKKQALKKYDQFSLNNLCKNFVKQSIASSITLINYFVISP